jgi:hypothetical protein
MLNGTIIFIALILVVACSLLGWLSALLVDTHAKRDGFLVLWTQSGPSSRRGL